INRAEGEVQGRDVTHKSVLHADQADEVPGVVFVRAVLVVGVAAHVLDADVFDPPGERVAVHGAAAVWLFDGVGQRGIDGNLVAIDPGNDAVGIEVGAPRFPRVAAVLVHADVVQPPGRAGTMDDDRIADVQAIGTGDVETTGAHRHVVVGNRRHGTGRVLR